MRSDTKYVVFDGHEGEQIIAFPKIIQHSVMANDVLDSSFGGMRPISGGFIVNGECVGMSESLRMHSRGDRDTALLKKMLNLDDNLDDDFGDKLNKFSPCEEKVQPNKNKLKRDRKKRTSH